jgi:hypothetical protein
LGREGAASKHTHTHMHTHAHNQPTNQVSHEREPHAATMPIYNSFKHTHTYTHTHTHTRARKRVSLQSACARALPSVWAPFPALPALTVVLQVASLLVQRMPSLVHRAGQALQQVVLLR